MNSLFSFLTTLYALLLLYFPSIFYPYLLSPVLLSTLLLLTYLLRLGAAQISTINPPKSDSTQPLPPHHTEEFHFRNYESDQKKDTCCLYAESFVEWDVRAPLEVIYEEFEGEDENDDSEVKREAQMNSIRRYASLSLYYPESDSDASSEREGGWESTESACFRWEEEDDRDGLIEITLDNKRSCDAEQDNLIEIDLSPER